MSLLRETWALHDVEDVERLARKSLDDTHRARRADLRPHQYDDALTYLLGIAWEISERWDPGRGGVTFPTFLYRILRLRTVDWWRAEFGRSKWQFRDSTYERERPAVFSLDVNRSGRDRLDTAIESQGSDPADGCDPAFSRLLTGGSRQLARDYEHLGLEKNGRAA